MLDSETRREIVLAALQGICANPATINVSAEDLARRALALAFELERQAPAISCGVG